MTSIVMQPGTVGFDAAAFHTVTDFAPFSCDWFSFYLGFGNGVSRATVEAAWRATKPVMLNCEGASSSGLGGAATGDRYAQLAINNAMSLGFDFLSPIIFSFVDFGPTPDQFPVLDACHKAMVDRMGDKPYGAYLPKNYGDHLVQQPWWDGVLWHWAGDHAVPEPWTTVQQNLNQKVVAGVTVDTNLLIKPMRFWNGDGPDPINPEEDDLLLPDERQWLIDVHSALLDPQPVKDPYGNQLNMLWATLYSADLACRPQGLVDAITASVVAALPAAATGGTADLGPLLAAINGLQGSLTSVAAAVADVDAAVKAIPVSGTWGK